MNLNTFIAKAGFCARRKAATLIKEGKVKVNGKVSIEPWYQVQKKDIIIVAGHKLHRAKEVYIIVNKPRGVTVTVEDKFAVRTITDLIPKKYGRVYPVGRLDKETRGLIMLTNDGELCHQLTHPKFEVEKEYIAVVKGEVSDAAMDKAKAGVTDEGEILAIKAYKIIKRGNDRSEIKLIIDEGKKRHIRRIFKCLGLDVLDLKRIRIGGLKLSGIPESSFVEIDRKTAYDLTLKK